MLKLFYAPGSCALAAHIALAESGASYEAVLVDFKNQQQRSPEYLAINPKGRVPALATGRGVLTENTAILPFIAQSFPEARLAPLDDPFAFGTMLSFLGYMATTVHVAHAHGTRGARWSDDVAAHASMKAKVPQNMRDCFELIQSKMLQGPWVLGEAYSVADAYLYTMSRWLPGDDVPLASLPAIAAHHVRMGQRPAVQRALEEEGIAP